MPKIKHKFIRVHWVSLKTFNLTPTEVLLLNLVQGLSNNKHKACYASKKALGIELNVATSTIYNTIDSLQRKGLLRSKRISMKEAHLQTTSKWQSHLNQVRSDNEPLPDEWSDIDN